MRIVVAVHHHQPIGTSHAVMEAAYRQTYAPLLQLLEESPHVALSLHLSGHLLEWLVDRHPEYIERLSELIARGQVEPLGGAHYEPILPAIPRRDRLGQIRLAADTLSQHFGVRPRGLWLPGGVWTPSLVGDLLEAGVEYTLLGSTHFLAAGVGSDALGGLYLTESAGESLRVFPGFSLPRSDSPFVDPRRFLAWFARPTAADARATRVMPLMVDELSASAERTALERVAPLPWLGGLFSELSRHGDALVATTMSHVVDLVAPVGRVDLPAGGTEELLAGARQTAVPEGPVAAASHDRLTCGVDWKAARLSEPLSRSLFVRGLEISRRLADLERALEDQGLDLDPVPNRDQVEAARRDLYRAQGECGRWPSGEGGWQQPQLRNEVFRNLVRAETRLEQLSGRRGRWSEVSVADFNIDARPEIRLANDRVVAYVSPEQGGQLYEFDVRAVASNLLSTWDTAPVDGESGGDLDAAQRSVTSARPFAARGVVDHLLLPGVSLDRFLRGEGALGAFSTARYTAGVRRSAQESSVRLSCEQLVGTHPVQVHKRLTLRPGESRLRIQYRLVNLPRNVPLRFGVEFQLNAASSGGGERLLYDQHGRTLGPCDTRTVVEPSARLGLSDESLGLDVTFEPSLPAEFWIFPTSTPHAQQAGQAVLQSTGVLTHWEFQADAEGWFEVSLDLVCDTSAAQARRLLDLAPPVRLATRSID